MSESVPGKFLGKVHFVPTIPKAIEGLMELSRNLWWTWNPRAREVFRMIDLETWISTRGNAVRFLRNVSQAQLDAAAANKDLLRKYDEVMKSFADYMHAENSWWRRHHGGDNENTLIAYFSAEYGLHEILQIYSGGLGVLSGDHMKSTSDLGIPMVAIGLLYHDGYFQQDIDQNGHQIARYMRQNWVDLPVYEVRDKDGRQLRIEIELPGRVVAANIWVIHVGRVPIYTLDTDLTENLDADRALTSRLYGGDGETRIQQEILLGMGGVKALRLLRKHGIIAQEPTIYHLNEGHAAFQGLERLRNYIQEDGLSIPEAREVIRASSIFTTHTPVPAGHDRFPIGLVDKYFRTYYESLQISRPEFLELGVEPMPDGQQLFSMTILALHFSAMANGVSQLHGDVSRRMMAPFWRDVPASETPIGSITNGVHTRTWMSFDMQNLLDKHIGPNWRDRIMHADMWQEGVSGIPDDEFWQTIGKLKSDLVRFIHDRLQLQHRRFGDMPDQLEKLNEVFTSDALTIGFARRFATYKRATLLFRDPDRLARIVGNPERPVQFVFAGKAHPADGPGQEFIRQIIEYSKNPAFQNRLVFLENYDMNIGRRLTSGVDVWLNNPRRPLEASGTSGMKVPLNGGLNFSILDGWWPEAYRLNPMVGWAIGHAKEYDDLAQQDAEDAEHLYRTLEKEIVPLYYDRDERGIPHGWLERVRQAMMVIAPMFNTDRMVTEYTEKYYVTGSRRYTELAAQQYAEARTYAKRKAELVRGWSQIRVSAEIASDVAMGSEMYSAPVKQAIDVRAQVYLGSLKPSDVIVEIYAQELKNTNGALPAVARFPMELTGKEKVDGLEVHVYKGALSMGESGEHGFTVRVIPNDPKLFHPQELGLVRWAQPA